MAIGSGLSAQAGMKAETTFGTYVAPDRFFEILSEGLVMEQGRFDSEGLGRGAYYYASRNRVWQKGAAGPTALEVTSKGMLLPLKHCHGALVSAQVAETDEYTHTFTPDPAALSALSATVQIGKPSSDGTVRPFSYLGSVVTSWTLELSEDGALTLTIEWAAREEVLSETLATATYPTAAQTFVFADAALLIAESATVVKSFTYTYTTGLDLTRTGTGAVLRRRPIVAMKVTGEGSLDAEFENLDAYNDFRAGEHQALELVLQLGEIAETGNPYEFSLTIPAIQYTGETPTVGGPEVLRQPLPFTAHHNGTDPLHTIVIHSDETAA